MSASLRVAKSGSSASSGEAVRASISGHGRSHSWASQVATSRPAARSAAPNRSTSTGQSTISGPSSATTRGPAGRRATAASQPSVTLPPTGG